MEAQINLTPTTLTKYSETHPSAAVFIKFHKDPTSVKWGEEHTAKIPCAIAVAYIELIESQTSLYAHNVWLTGELI